MKTLTTYFFIVVIMFSCKQKQENITVNNGGSANKINNSGINNYESSSVKNSTTKSSQDVKKSVEKLISLLEKKGYTQQETSKDNFIEDIFKTDIISFEKKRFINSALKVSVGKAYISLLVYEYSDLEKSHNIFNTIQKERFKDDYLDKNWDILTVFDKYIIRVDAGCIISIDNWSVIKESFIQIYDGSKIIYCNCGGMCK